MEQYGTNSVGNNTVTMEALPRVTMATIAQSNDSITTETMAKFSINLHIQYVNAHFDIFVKVASIFLIILGTMGNIMSIIILRHDEIGYMTTKIYLISLSVVDLLCLDVGLMRRLLELYGIDIRVWNDVGCKLGWYVPYVLFTMSYWIQVMISVDRYIATKFPFRYRTITIKHRGVAISAIAVLFLAYESPALFYYKIIEGECSWDSVINNGYKDYINTAWPWIDVVISFVIPFVIMTGCSVVMIQQLSKTERTVRRSLTVNDETGVMRETGDGKRRTARLFIALNIVFIVTNLPKRVVKVCHHTGLTDIDHYTWDITWLLMYSNHAVNFIFYVVLLPKFRTILKKMFHCGVDENRDDGNSVENGIERSSSIVVSGKDKLDKNEAM